MRLRHSVQTIASRSRGYSREAYAVVHGSAVERLGQLFIVCDSFGGINMGSQSSCLACQMIISTYYGNSSEDRSIAIKETFELTNTHIHKHRSGDLLAISTAVIFHQNELIVAHVGDSRAYLIRNGQLRQITQDHTLIRYLIQAGQVTWDQVRYVPVDGSRVLRALGADADVGVDLFQEPLQTGDRVLLCTDGLYWALDDDEIAQVIQDFAPEEAAERLIRLYQANNGMDDVTAVVIQIESLL